MNNLYVILSEPHSVILSEAKNLYPERSEG